MNGLVKKYLPYGVVILLIYMLVPIIFISKSLQGFSTVAYYFIFPATAIVCAAMYCSKYGMGMYEFPCILTCKLTQKFRIAKYVSA